LRARSAKVAQSRSIPARSGCKDHRARKGLRVFPARKVRRALQVLRAPRGPKGFQDLQELKGLKVSKDRPEG
jgi:hypothetical protein